MKEESQGGRKSGNGEKAAGSVAAPGWLKDRWERLSQFFHDVRAELRHVTWPTRNDVKATTAVVLATVAFFAVYFFIVDLGMGSFVQWVLHSFRK